MESQPKPKPPQLAWQEAELGALFSYDLHVLEKRYLDADPDHNRRHAIDAKVFNPGQLDTDQWLQVAKDMGARFALLTASHETGFRLWQSDANPFCLKAVRWGDGKRDIVAEFIASCKKYGIKPGIFYGSRWNAHLGLWDFRVTDRSPVTQEEYNAMIEQEVEELCTRYGPLFELWFDGGAHGPEQGGPDVLRIFEKYQPDCLFYHNLQRADARWGGSEKGMVGYPCWATFPYHCTGTGGSAGKNIEANNYELLKHGDPDGKYWMPAMSDAPLRNHAWFWRENFEDRLYPLESLMDMYYRSVGRNSTLIIGLSPDNRGLIPAPDAKRCAEWGNAVQRIFSRCIGQTSGTGEQIELELGEGTPFDHIVVQEDIRDGERVRDYAIEVLRNEAWEPLVCGTCIGHKRIHKLDAPVAASGLRLKIKSSVSEPLIRSLAVYQAANNNTSGYRVGQESV